MSVFGLDKKIWYRKWNFPNDHLETCIVWLEYDSESGHIFLKWYDCTDFILDILKGLGFDSNIAKLLLSFARDQTAQKIFGKNILKIFGYWDGKLTITRKEAWIEYRLLTKTDENTIYFGHRHEKWFEYYTCNREDDIVKYQNCELNSYVGRCKCILRIENGQWLSPVRISRIVIGLI